MTAKDSLNNGHVLHRRDTRAPLVRAMVLVLLTLGTRELVAQQPLGQIAYTVGTLDYSEVHLRIIQGSDRIRNLSKGLLCDQFAGAEREENKDHRPNEWGPRVSPVQHVSIV